MKFRTIITIAAVFAAFMLLCSCSNDDNNKTSEISYSLTKFVCTDGSGNDHKLASSLKQQLENGCTACKGKDTGSAKKYFDEIIDGFATVENTPYSYEVSVSYTEEQSGFFHWKETLM